MTPPFRDRHHAGRVLAGLLIDYGGRPDVLVLGLPRGGVPVAFAVAEALDAPLDVALVRKLGVPSHQGQTLGAVAPSGVQLIDESLVIRLGITRSQIWQLMAAERHELERWRRLYQDDRPQSATTRTTVILVDDGLVTGLSMCVAARAFRQRGAGEVVAAVPVAVAEACESVRGEVDELVYVLAPERFESEAAWYKEFPETSDTEARALLDRADRRGGGRVRERGAPEDDPRKQGRREP